MLYLALAAGGVAAIVVHARLYRELGQRLRGRTAVDWGGFFYLPLLYLRHRREIRDQRLDLLALADTVFLPLVLLAAYLVSTRP